MAVKRYSVVAHDWVNLEFILNDLTRRVVGQEVHSTSSPTFAEGTITGDMDIGGDLDVTGDISLDGALTLDILDASEFVFTDADKALVSVDVPLVVAYGGTGTDTLTNHGLLLGSGTGAITPLGNATDGQLPIGSAGADPVLATLTGTEDEVDITNSAGGIQIGLVHEMLLREPVTDWHDPTEGLPEDPEVGDRYISEATASGWTIDYFYEWDGESWVEEEPSEGWMVWMILEFMFYFFFSGGWIEADSKVSVDADAIPGYLGAASNDGVLRTSAPLSYTDGGDYVTLGLAITSHSMIVGSGTAITELGVATNGQLPIGSTDADPVLATLTGTENEISISNGAGSITVALANIIDLGVSA